MQTHPKINLLKNIHYSKALQAALAKNQNCNPKRAVRLKEIIKRVGISKTAIYQLIKQGEFPRSFSLGGRMVAWLESDIDAFIESRLVNIEK